MRLAADQSCATDRRCVTADVDPYLVSGAGSPLMRAAGGSDDASTLMVRALLAAHANVDVRMRPRGRVGTTCVALRPAYLCGLRTGICTSLTNVKTATPLHSAAVVDANPDVVRRLLAACADLQVKAFACSAPRRGPPLRPWGGGGAATRCA